MADARLSPSDVTHVNSHGTSTPPGDAAEAEAIYKVFGCTGAGRDFDQGSDRPHPGRRRGHRGGRRGAHHAHRQIPPTTGHRPRSTPRSSSTSSSAARGTGNRGRSSPTLSASGATTAAWCSSRLARQRAVELPRPSMPVLDGQGFEQVLGRRRWRSPCTRPGPAARLRRRGRPSARSPCRCGRTCSAAPTRRRPRRPCATSESSGKPREYLASKAAWRLGGSGLMPITAVRADLAEHVAQRAGLGRAPGRVGLRVEVDQHLAALKARQGDLVAGLVGQVERRRRVAGL